MPQPMRIGFDGRFIRPGQTGNGVFSQHWLEGLARLDRQNRYTVYLVGKTCRVAQENFCYKQMPPLHVNSHVRFCITFPLELWRHRVDLFHAIYSVPFRTYSRVVLSLVEIGWFTNPDDFPASSFFLTQVRLMTRYSIRRADRIVTPTEIGRSRLINYFQLPETKVTTIPFGFNECFLMPVSEDEIVRVKRKFGIAQHYLLHVGDLHPRKNLGMLTEAYTRFREAGRHSHQLVLVGKDHWRAHEIKQKAASSPVARDIIFTGYVSTNELNALYHGATLFVFPSLDEGFGLPVHEAMAAGLPVITSGLDTLRENAGKAAIYINPHDPEELASAINQVLDNDEMRRGLVEQGKQQIGEFTWESSCRKLLRVYEEIGSPCSSSRTSSP